MAAPKAPRGVEKKRKSKKRKARTEVSSSESSSSESEVETKKSTETASSDSESKKSSPEPAPKPAKKEKKKQKNKSTADTNNEDVPMREASFSPALLPAPEVLSKSKIDEDFDAVYIRKITTEMADDLDKVREAQDFKANSIPMLVHALKQGEALFSTEEKRRVVASARA